jgi:hypothetical protein
MIFDGWVMLGGTPQNWCFRGNGPASCLDIRGSACLGHDSDVTFSMQLEKNSKAFSSGSRLRCFLHVASIVPDMVPEHLNPSNQKNTVHFYGWDDLIKCSAVMNIQRLRELPQAR